MANIELFIGPMGCCEGAVEVLTGLWQILNYSLARWGKMGLGVDAGAVRCVSVWQDVCCCAALSQNVFGAVRGHTFDN